MKTQAATSPRKLPAVLAAAAVLLFGAAIYGFQGQASAATAATPPLTTPSNVVYDKPANLPLQVMFFMHRPGAVIPGAAQPAVGSAAQSQPRGESPA